MPTIAGLKERLESIPSKRDNKNLVGKLRQYGSAFGTVEISLSESLKSLEFGVGIFPELRTAAVASNLSVVRKSAEKIHDRLVSDLTNIQSKYVEEKFLDVRDKTGYIRSNISDNWKRLINNKLDRFSGLIKAASDAGVDGAASVEATIGILRNEANKPPLSSLDAARITSQFEQLENAVIDLKLTGKGGEFLVAAAAGKADARCLRDEEVVEFIEKYDLWHALSVRLG